MLKFLRLSLVALMLAAMSSVAMAQSTVDGAIGGTVNDPNGAVVPNATVTVKNEGTNKESTATTDSEGRFRVVQLPPGNYTVAINASGFGAFTQSNVVVEVGRVTSLEIPLSVGDVGGGQVEVTAEAPVINTSQQDFSSNVNQTSINELPINGRRASNFVLLTPGVAPDGNFGLISFRGVSGLLNNSTVDGGDNNQAFFSEERGRTRINYAISQAAVREFQVNTSNYSAEYGRAAGGVVNTVTKSGTNDFHGDIFYYIRDNKWGARNPFTLQSVQTPSGVQIIALKPKDQRHQFGGTIGGPIVKDKLFFFFSYDEQRRDFPGVAAPANPNLLSPITVAATLPANCAATNLTPGQILRCRGITQAQTDAGLAYVRNLTGVVTRRGDQRLLLPKIDWTINDSNTFTATYNRLRWDSPAGVQTQAVVQRGTNSFGDDIVEIDTLNLRLSSSLTPTIFNEFRFQYSRDLEIQRSQPPGPGEPTTGPGGFPPSAAIGGSAGITLGKPNFLERRSYPDEKRWQFADTMTLTRGRHTFKFGGDFNHVRDVLDNLFQEGGVYTYGSITDFITDFSAPAQKRYTFFNQGFGPSLFRFETKDVNLFIQDDFRITPRLTVNLGLRYELEMLPDPQIPNPLEPRTAVFPADNNNFGPRFGFAYDIFGDGKTSIRGGYGIYYGRIINSTISNAITNTGVSTGQRQVSLTPSQAGSPTYPNVLTAPPGAAGVIDIVVFSPHMANPQIHQADLVLEREVAKNTVVSVSFLSSLGRRLPTFVDTNLPVARLTTTYTVNGGPFGGQVFTVPRFVGPRPNPNFSRITEIRSTIKSEYAGLVLQANRRFTDGLQFQVNYTFSKATDTGQISQTFTSSNVPLNPFDYTLEEGRSNFDIPHRFVASAVYSPGTPFGLKDSPVGRAILGGWTLSPIVVISSGRPYSAIVSGNAPTGAGPTLRTSTGILGAGGANRLPIADRNLFRFPKTVAVDLRLSRRFHFNETMNLEFLAEGFNIFNRQNITDLTDLAYIISGTTLNFNNSFTVPTAAGNSIYRERQIQLAVRFQF